MALAATTIHEIRTTGSDTLNGGMFDPGQTAGMLTDLTVTSGGDARIASPIVKSASYNFVNGDINAYLFVALGASWTPGWYKITAVASNEATIDASVGAVSMYNSATPYPLINTAAGVATVQTPTGGTFAIDYSQQAAAQFAYTDLASAGAGNTCTSAALPFGKQQVGNSFVITAGTNFQLGRYTITSVATVTATVTGAGNLTLGVGSGGTGGQGGAWASPGAAGSVQIAGNKFFIKAGTYTIASASNNVATGCLSVTAQAANANAGQVIGYNAVRYDGGTRPLLQSDGSITTFTIITTGAGNHVENVSVDGNSRTSSRGFSVASGTAYKCKAANCTNSGFSSGRLLACEATGCATQPAFISQLGMYFCYAYSNTIAGFSSFTGVASHCISANNSGASTDGFTAGFGVQEVYNCLAYNNGRDGFRFDGGSGNAAHQAVNCISYANAAYNFAFPTAAFDNVFLWNCASGSVGTGAISNPNWRNTRGLITLTADPFTAKASGDFSLNTTAGGGALLRALGIVGVFPNATTTGYQDVGAVQHADPAGGGGLASSILGGCILGSR